jgi:hypothetical protein
VLRLEVESVKFYLLRAFRNQLFKTLQTFKTVPLEDDFDDLNFEDSFETFFIAEESLQGILHKVSSSLKQLPERQREILYLPFYKDLRQYAQARNFEVITQFIDYASGTSEDKRTQYKLIMTAAKKRNIDVVLVWRYDRFARSTKALMNALK